MSQDNKKICAVDNIRFFNAGSLPNPDPAIEVTGRTSDLKTKVTVIIGGLRAEELENAVMEVILAK